jgi:hypothetical protein
MARPVALCLNFHEELLAKLRELLTHDGIDLVAWELSGETRGEAFAARLAFAAPRVIACALVYPYVEALEFLLAVRRRLEPLPPLFVWCAAPAVVAPVVEGVPGVHVSGPPYDIEALRARIGQAAAG